MAQPQEINHIIINDTLYLKHFCTKSTENYKKWETILYNSKSGKQLNLDEFTIKQFIPRHLKSNRFIQIFEALLLDKKLYTLVYNFGIISINCDIFNSPTTFTSITHPFTSYHIPSFGSAPYCHGQLKKIDNDIYIFIDIVDKKRNYKKVATGIYIFTADEKLLKIKDLDDNYFSGKRIPDRQHPEKGVLEDVDLDSNRQMVSDTIKNVLMKHLPADSLHSFEYVDYFSDRAPKTHGQIQEHTYYYFLYRANGKMNYIEYYVRYRGESRWIMPKETVIEPIVYTHEIMQLVK